MVSSSYKAVRWRSISVIRASIFVILDLKFSTFQRADWAVGAGFFDSVAFFSASATASMAALSTPSFSR
eukprot:2202514-Pyramimonas_sp.AAC.1